MSDTTSDDVEDRRIDELLAAQTRGVATPAETEELALYVEQQPKLARRVEQAVRDGELGRGWLDRVERDHQVERVEESPRARVEQGAGLGLAGAGVLAWMFSPVVGVPLVGMGALLVLYSLVRVRLKTHAADPKMLAQSREQSIDRMRSEALELGANAILAIRFTTSTVMQGAAEILVYGTGVVVEPVEP